MPRKKAVPTDTELTPIVAMSRDLAKASTTMHVSEARFLVDSYYQAQEKRKRSYNQVRALGESLEPNSVILWFAEQNEMIEKQLKRALDKYTMAQPVGQWLRDIKGIGPVLAAGILAHIDITKAPTAGHIWRYAGLDPSQVWTSSDNAKKWVKENGVDLLKASIAFNIKFDTLERMASTNREGESIKPTAASLANAICRRPWNASLKTLIWKVGQSFMKLSNDDDCIYGRLYRERKAQEVARNEGGGNAAAAARDLARYGSSTDAYQHLLQGKLPPAQVDARARRWVVKIFISHLQQMWYEAHYGEPAPKPFAIAILGHAHQIQPQR